jgi:methionyl-tRNA formyltransferase
MKYTKQPWIILFGGAGREGVIERLVAEGIDVRLVLVPVKQSSRLMDSVARLTNLNMPIKAICREGLSDTLSVQQECLLLSLGFPYIIPKSIYSRHKVALNIHPTLLPKYRGPTTGAYILINNEKGSGSTVHFLEEEVDKGDIIAQSHVSLTAFDTVRSLQRKTYEKEPSLIIEALHKLDIGAPPTPQDEATSTTYPNRRKPENSEIDPTKPLIELFNEIRACDPEDFPAFFYRNGHKIYVKLWRDSTPTSAEDEL